MDKHDGNLPVKEEEALKMKAEKGAIQVEKKILELDAKYARKTAAYFKDTGQDPETSYAYFDDHQKLGNEIRELRYKYIGTSPPKVEPKTQRPEKSIRERLSKFLDARAEREALSDTKTPGVSPGKGPSSEQQRKVGP